MFIDHTYSNTFLISFKIILKGDSTTNVKDAGHLNSKPDEPLHFWPVEKLVSQLARDIEKSKLKKIFFTQMHTSAYKR